MIRTILLLLTFLSFSLNSKAQFDNEEIQKFSASTLQYLSSIKSNVNHSVNPKFVYHTINNKPYINAFVKVNEELDLNKLVEMGILVGTKAGDIWTIKIPIDKVELLARLEQGIELIQLDQPIYSNMEKARKKTKVELVHEGIGLPQAYTGKDVVVGILDVGFDYTHPTFYDEIGNNYRIKKVWEQKTAGTPPSSYSYGHELTEATDIILQQTDNATQSHGSHVAGIAAGSGFGGEGDKYRGVAYESEIVFVGITPAQEQWTNTGMTDIVDGLNYIYEYAASQGKPAIANLSWGCSIGPHDGTSLFSQAVNNLTGAGKIFTISAGNNGGNNIHINKQFSDTDTLVQSFVGFSPSLVNKKTWIDIWGETGESFCIQLGAYAGSNLVSATDYLCLDNTMIDTFLIGSDKDTFFLNLTALSADINGKPHALLDIHSKTNNSISISIKGTSGAVNMWMGYVLESRGYYGEFVRNNIPGAYRGNDKMTIGEMACTKSAITVGAYASKIAYTSLSGQTTDFSSYVLEDRICPFSSKGPTTDDRIKPDIAAPGMFLASAVNSFDSSFVPGGSNTNSIVHEHTDTNSARNYYFGELRGTSMSAPVAAGIIALLLEANPNLTPDEIINLMAATAIKDAYTTDTPDPNKWGYGKIDAYEMMKSFFISGLEENTQENNILYPNPTTDILNLDWSGTKSIVITNLMGETCIKVTTNDKYISLKDLNTGTYMVVIYSAEGKSVIKQKIVKI